MHTRKTIAEYVSPGLSRAGILCLTVAVLTACSVNQPSSDGRYSQKHDSAPDRLVDVSHVKDAIPRVEPYSRYGNPPSYVVRGKRYYTQTSSAGYSERGIASWYGTKFHGHRTSSGESYDMYSMSAAHKTLPLPTYARVTNLGNGKSVIVKINDRGPFHENRLIDLSYAAAARLGILGKGTGLVEVAAIDPGDFDQPAKPTLVKQAVQASKPKIATASPAGDKSGTPSLYLQLGAFSSRSNAERLLAKFSDSKLPAQAHISQGIANQQPIYRVRIGPLASVETADRLTETLIGQGIQSPRVVID